jgi:DNA-binding transcriptional MerR regulator
MMTVHEVAQRAGVSVRTLHYYDQVHLLSPAKASAAGYRLYSDEDLIRLQRILFLRELDFPLREIAPMLIAEEPDQKQAVERHRELLQAKVKRLQGLIDLCGRILKGVDQMKLDDFNRTQEESLRNKYAQEARARWGATEAYKESERRTATYGKQDWADVKAESDAILREFASLVGQEPTSAAVRAALTKWRDHISGRYYPCTDEILAGLGEMYVADERFRNTLESFGAGTANLMREAIRANR